MESTSLQLSKKPQKSQNPLSNIINFSFSTSPEFEGLKSNALLSLSLSELPQNYNFEIYKSILKIREISKEKDKNLPLVALQFPEGLVAFSLIIADILEKFSPCKTYIIGDTTYGACCLVDIDACLLGCDLLIHYSHSCLIPISKSMIKTLYIFVEISLNSEHLFKTIYQTFHSNSQDSPTIFLCSSIQFNSSLFVLKRKLTENGFKKEKVIIPQCRPRMPGEVIGCTAPDLKKYRNSEDAVVVFVCDGRFHMEGLMIQNPQYKYYQYNPFTGILSLEEYDIDLMKKARFYQIEQLKSAAKIGVIFGTLGRQGNEGILRRVCRLLDKNKKEYEIILMNEITEEKIKDYNCDAFVQLACPRLSIDWSDQFSKPMLTPYELYLAFNEVKLKDDIYEMSNYSSDTGPYGHLFKEG